MSYLKMKSISDVIANFVVTLLGVALELVVTSMLIGGIYHVSLQEGVMVKLLCLIV